MQTQTNSSPYTIPFPFAKAIEYASRIDFSALQHPWPKASEQLQQSLDQKTWLALLSSGVEQSNTPFITIADDIYPQQLREIPCAPPVLFYQGNIDLLRNPMVGIVGTRHCSLMAKKFTAEFSKTIADTASVVSGLAYGIDQIAHTSALSKTIGICPDGLEQPLSGYRKQLQEQIIAGGGLLLSEFHPKTPVHKKNYIQRNRTLAGLCKAVIVMEAPSKSGALLSAQNALDFGREVFAVPNHPYHESAHGCLQLLQQGAHIAISAIDILEQIDIQSPKPSSDYLKELFPYPCSIFELSQRLQMNLSDVIDLVEKLHNQRLVETDGLLWYPQKR